MFISLRDSFLPNTNYNYNVFVARLVLIMSHNKCVNLVQCPLICKLLAAITPISFTVPSSLPIKLFWLCSEMQLQPDHHTMALWDLELHGMFPADNAVALHLPNYCG